LNWGGVYSRAVLKYKGIGIFSITEYGIYCFSDTFGSGVDNRIDIITGVDII
jgi:hypothetical protein